MNTQKQLKDLITNVLHQLYYDNCGPKHNNKEYEDLPEDQWTTVYTGSFFSRKAEVIKHKLINIYNFNDYLSGEMVGYPRLSNTQLIRELNDFYRENGSSFQAFPRDLLTICTYMDVVDEELLKLKSESDKSCVEEINVLRDNLLNKFKQMFCLTNSQINETDVEYQLSLIYLSELL